MCSVQAVVVYQALLWGTHCWNRGFRDEGETAFEENFPLPLSPFGWQADMQEVTIQYDERGPWDPDALEFGEWCAGRQALQTA